MRVINYTEFRTDLAENLPVVRDNSEIIVVKNER